MTLLRKTIILPVVVAWNVLFLIASTSAQTDEADLLNVRDAIDAPIQIIFDTDIGGDIDDAFALELLHVFADRGICNLLGVTLTNSNVAAARYVAAFNARYGRPDLPVGYSPNCRVTDSYPTKTIEKRDEDGNLVYPVPEGFEPQDAVKLLRKLLANAQDGQVVVIQVGACYNLANLLATEGDDISPLSGLELAKKKVRLVSVMGGAFAVDPTAEAYRLHKEWNIICDIPAAQKFAAEWPSPVVYSGYEVGDRIRMSPVNLKRDYKGRSAILYDSFGFWTAKNTKEGYNHRRPTWDLTSVLFVLRPEEGRDYFTLSEPGDVQFDDQGVTLFTPNKDGLSRCFLQTPEQRARVSEAFVNLCALP
ncbi:MAG: nucleoside hydrolase [Planctomycetia bacterium]|nr:nucleoside hydrolase [Planctomycetia bacterium]